MLALFRRAVAQAPIIPASVGAVRHVRAGRTHSGARARFRLNDKNIKLIERMRRGKNHFNLHKSGRRLKRLGTPTVVSKADYSRIMRLLGK